MSKETVIHVDGSSLNNQSAERRAGYAIIFGPSDPRNRMFPVEGSKQTNNVAELNAVLAALEATEPDEKSLIVSDSEYVVKGLVGMNGQKPWIENWQRNGWHTANRQPVKNREIWERLLAISKKRSFRMRWQKAHIGHAGNDAADRAAKQAAARRFAKYVDRK